MITALKPYKVYAVDPRKAIITAETAKLYDLEKTTQEEMESFPIAYGYAGEEVIIAGVAKHDNGEKYYLPNLDRAEGYRFQDFKKHLDFIGDTIINEEEQEPKYGPDDIFAPVLSPNTEDMIHVGKIVPCYPSLSDAYQKRQTRYEFKPGNYYVYKRLSGMLHLTSHVGIPSGFWLNPDDLTDKSWYELAKIYDEPKYYQAIEAAEVVDLLGGPNARGLVDQQPILIAGEVTGPDGLDYYLPDPTFQRGEWKAVRQRYLKRFPSYRPPVKEEPPQVTAVVVETPQQVSFRDTLTRIKVMLINRYKGTRS